ncbi:MAG: hypothetical protein JRJ87_20640 [Deltaproteobacteria bacterium]|nr:hypothetical protein [Deltaproteobacteria bacterium]
MTCKCLWLGLIVALLPLCSLADDSHYQDYIIGDQAVSLGGAYTAIAADPSGLWYNPAGIVDVRNTSLSLSANLYGIQDSSVGSSEAIFPEDPISKLVIVPSSAGFVQALGRIDHRGQRPFAIGMSIVIPYFRKFSTSEEGTSEDQILGNYRHGYHRAFEDQTLWVGAGGAMRLHDRFSIGVGFVLVHRSVQDAASSFIATDFVGGEFNVYRNAMMDLNFSNDSLLLTAGFKWKIVDNLYFGAMIRSPSLTVYSTGNMRFSRSMADSNGNSGFLPTPEEAAVKSETRINGEARAGIAWILPELLTLSADVSLHMPVSYTLVDIEIEDERARNALRDALLISPSVSRGFVINVNLGAEVQFLNRFSIGLGAYSNFASSPAIPDSDSIRPTQAHVHMIGGTIAFGVKSKHTLTRLGFAYARGSGTDVIAHNDDPSQLALDVQDFERINLTQTYMYFFLASTFMY